MGYYDIVVYWGYGHMDLMWSILLLLRLWIEYDYTVIQVVCWVELPEQKRLCSIFVKIWIPINGTQQCGIGVTQNPQEFRELTGCQRNPRIWGVTTPIRFVMSFHFIFQHRRHPYDPSRSFVLFYNIDDTYTIHHVWCFVLA